MFDLRDFISKAIRFYSVSLAGMVVNAIAFSILLSYAFEPHVANALAIVVAGGFNFAGNVVVGTIKLKKKEGTTTN